MMPSVDLSPNLSRGSTRMLRAFLGGCGEPAMRYIPLDEEVQNPVAVNVESAINLGYFGSTHID